MSLKSPCTPMELCVINQGGTQMLKHYYAWFNSYGCHENQGGNNHDEKADLFGSKWH